MEAISFSHILKLEECLSSPTLLHAFHVIQQEEKTPYKFYVNECEITSTLADSLDEETLEASEKVLEIVYQPQAVFKVRAVTRCTSTIEGHAEAVISVSFSPDGR